MNKADLTSRWWQDNDGDWNTQDLCPRVDYRGFSIHVLKRRSHWTKFNPFENDYYLAFVIKNGDENVVKIGLSHSQYDDAITNAKGYIDRQWSK
jgi:hypothetical protein